MSSLNRRHDIDWMRVIAIALLVVYHVAISFQPWGIMIGFITNNEPIPPLWIPMAMLNVWRIPFLFFVSGMGVYFAMQQRSWGSLISERTIRILLPYLFGMFCIFPISSWIFKHYYNWETDYNFHPGHLWFLGNIFTYVLILSPAFYYMKKHENTNLVRAIIGIFRTPLGVVPVIGMLVLEVLLVQPNPYELYAMTWHGFFLGLIAFFYGFCFVLSGDAFWKMITQWRWLFFAIALSLFIIRMIIFQMRAPVYLIPVESVNWIFTILAFGSRYLNRESRALTYLSEAAYPVYIIHLIFMSLGAALIFPLEIPATLKFILMLIFTFGGCLVSYEFLIRRITLIRPLFGLKLPKGTLNYVRKLTLGKLIATFK
jgi:glucans biosynthesis protein C